MVSKTTPLRRSCSTALQARADARPDALTSFDYACFLASLQQMKSWYKEDLSRGLNGSEYVKTAATVRSNEMQSALRLMEGAQPLN